MSIHLAVSKNQSKMIIFITDQLIIRYTCIILENTYMNAQITIGLDLFLLFPNVFRLTYIGFC